MPGFTAGVYSTNGLIRFFWKTDSEKRNGLMTIANQSEWLSRLGGASASLAWTNPTTTIPPKPSTSDLGKEWWAVWNYLGYNAGACVIGGTGDELFKTVGTTYGPIHSTNESLNVIFSGGNATSAQVAADAAKLRQDCFAVVGITKNSSITPASNYDNHAVDFGPIGFTGANGANTLFVAGRKNFFLDYNASGIVDIDKIDVASDVAGCFGRTFKSTNEWSIPSGVKRGAINGVLALDQSFSATEQTQLLDRGVNPVVTLPGKGTYFMGNSTGAGCSGSAGSTYGIANMHIVSLLNYLKGSLKGIATDYLFEPNTESNRGEFVSRANSVLDNIKNSGNITTYSVVCNPAENQGITFTATVNITPVNVAETIQLKVVNGSTTEIYTL
jgi:hypothetical protein